MNIGNGLIYFNFLILCCSLFFAIWGIKENKENRIEYARKLSWLLFIGTSGCLILLLKYFYQTDLTYQYVSNYSAESLDTGYRIAGIWAGREGTLLVWIWACLGSLCIEDKIRKERNLQTNLTFLITMTVVLALAIIQLFINPFIKNEIPPIEGNGLNPLLLSPYMIIHPPLVFTSYGFVVILFAAAMAHLITNDEEWIPTVKRWGRISWLGITTALSLGGYWAYVTLGWGGYWAWDPVETAGLLPWIALNIFLHTTVMNKRKKQYGILGPLMALLVFVLILFESFVTRGGVWLSLHAFLPSQSTSATQRFFDVMETDKSVMGFFILIIMATCIAIFLSMRKYRRREIKEEKNNLEDRAFFAAIYLQTLILSICFVLLLMGVNGTLPPEVFETRLAPFFILMAIAFVMHTSHKWLGSKNVLKLSVFCLVLTFGLAYYTGKWGERAWMFGAAVPWFILTGASILEYLYRYRKKRLRTMLRVWGPYTTHLGVLIMIMGYCVSYGLATEESLALEKGNEEEILGFTITVEDVKTEIDGEQLVREIHFVLKENNETIIDDKLIRTVTNNLGQEIPEVYIDHQLRRDLYITADMINLENDSARITVREIPGIMLVWFGIFLMIGGMLLLQITEWRITKGMIRNLDIAKSEKEEVDNPITMAGKMVFDTALFTASLPERYVRSATGIFGGTLKETTDIVLPSMVRNMTSYKLMVGNILRFAIENIAEVDDAYGDEENIGDEFVARKMVGNVIEGIGLATVHVSPLWVFAFFADGVKGGKEYLKKVHEELVAGGYLDEDTDPGSLHTLFEGLERSTSKVAKNIDIPPLSKDEIIENLTEMKDSILNVGSDTGKVAEDIGTVMQDFVDTATEEGNSMLELSGILTLEAVNKAKYAAATTVAGTKVAGDILYENIFTYYGSTLADIHNEGYTTVATRTMKPYGKALAKQFDTTRKTTTERFILSIMNRLKRLFSLK